MDLFLKVAFYIIATAVPTVIGLHLSSKAERNHVLYRLVFLSLFVVGVLLAVWVEIRANRSHKAEVAAASADRKELSAELAEQRQENAFLRGKFDTMSVVLGGMAKDSSQASSIASILANSARQSSLPNRNVPEAAPSQIASPIHKLAELFGEGEQLDDACQRAGNDPSALGDLKQYATWEKEATAGLVDVYGQDVLLRMDGGHYRAPVGSPMSQFCWDFQEKQQRFNFLYAHHGGQKP